MITVKLPSISSTRYPDSRIRNTSECTAHSENDTTNNHTFPSPEILVKPIRITTKQSAQNESQHTINATYSNTMLIPTTFGIPKPFSQSPETTKGSLHHDKARKLKLFRSSSFMDVNSHSSSSTYTGNRSSLSSAFQFDIDETEFVLREKARNNYRELRRNFIINDVEGLGNIRRDALTRILTRLLYRPVRTKHVNHLLNRLGFRKDTKIINFTEFYTALCCPNKIGSSGKKTSSQAKPKSLEPLSAQFGNISSNETHEPIKAITNPTECSTMIQTTPDSNNESKWSFVTELQENSSQKQTWMHAPQVMAILRQHLQTGSLSIDDLVDLNHSGETAKMDKWNFFTRLKQLGFSLSCPEFSKLWRRIDKSDSQTIPVDNFLHQMCLDPKPIIPNQTLLALTNEQNINESVKSPSYIDLVKNLNRKFRKGFSNACKTVEQCEREFWSSLPEEIVRVRSNVPLANYVTPDVFLAALKRLQLPVLKKIQLANFFNRYGLTPNASGLLPYRELFRRFQDRSEAGVAHQLLADSLIAKRDYNDKADSNVKLINEVEKEIIRRFHCKFLSLLNTFRNYDTNRVGTVSLEQFRSILFNNFGYEFSEQSFADLIDHMPLGFDGHLKYGEFMRQFDSNALANPDFTGDTCEHSSDENRKCLVTSKPNTKDETNSYPSENNQSKTPIHHPNKSTMTHHRSIQELYDIIHNVLSQHVKRIEHRFHQLDEYNTGKLTQEQFYQLFKSLNIEPEITRGEIRNLWPKFFVDHNQSLCFNEFIRHFLYRKSEAAYPNAKLVPPKLGDADLMPISNTLNGTRNLIKGSWTAKIELLFKKLHAEFVEMDPKGTGFVSRDQFVEVLTELCLHIEDHELEELMEKLHITPDGRISYLTLLKPFAQKLKTTYLQMASTRKWNSLSEEDQSGLRNRYNQSIVSVLEGVKPTTKISRLGWNKLHRNMQQADQSKTGRISAPKFRDLFEKGTGVKLTDEQVYQLLTALDPEVSGTLPYSQLIQEAHRSCTASQMSQLPQDLSVVVETTTADPTTQT